MRDRLAGDGSQGCFVAVSASCPARVLCFAERHPGHASSTALQRSRTLADRAFGQSASKSVSLASPRGSMSSPRRSVRAGRTARVNVRQRLEAILRQSMPIITSDALMTA